MIRFSEHARQRMHQRGITEQDVAQALARPIGAPVPGRGPTVWIRGHAVGGRILKVLVRAADRRYVITAVWE